GQAVVDVKGVRYPALAQQAEPEEVLGSSRSAELDHMAGAVDPVGHRGSRAGNGQLRRWIESEGQIAGKKWPPSTSDHQGADVGRGTRDRRAGRRFFVDEILVTLAVIDARVHGPEMPVRQEIAEPARCPPVHGFTALIGRSDAGIVERIGATGEK